MLRPSGTEPKLKCYLQVCARVGARADLGSARAAAAADVGALTTEVAALVGLPG